MSFTHTSGRAFDLNDRNDCCAVVKLVNNFVGGDVVMTDPCVAHTHYFCHFVLVEFQFCEQAGESLCFSEVAKN